jgi:hypothetical protein
MVQVAATSTSPRTSSMLTEDPGCSEGGTGASEDVLGAEELSKPAPGSEPRPEVVPPAAMVSSAVPAVCCCQKRMASGLNPLRTSGVSMGRKIILPSESGDGDALSPTPSASSPRASAEKDGASRELVDGATARSGADRSRTSSICPMGVMPAMGSLVNCPMRYESAPTSLPSM